MFLFDAATGRDLIDALRLLEGRLSGTPRRLSEGAREVQAAALRSVRVRNDQVLPWQADQTESDTVTRLLTYQEAAGRLGVSESTVKRLVHQGDIQTVRVLRARRIHSDEIDEFMTRLRTAS
jgi:excisionase family DNA binding protein